MKRRFVVSIMCLVILVMAGCITISKKIIPVNEMTPKQKSAAAMAVYNSMADSYKHRVALPDLSKAEKVILNVEYKTLVEIWPVIEAYDNFVAGKTDSIDAAIIRQLNQFLLNYRY